jgi:hypothetical protein
MEPAESPVSRHRASGAERSGELEVCRDADPDNEEGGQNPQEERGLGHRQPGKLFSPQEEPCPTGRSAVTVVFDDLAAHGFGRIVRRTPVAIAVAVSPPPCGPQSRHLAILAGNLPLAIPERSRT